MFSDKKERVAPALWELREVLYDNDIDIIQSKTGIQLYIGDELVCDCDVINADSIDEIGEEL